MGLTYRVRVFSFAWLASQRLLVLHGTFLTLERRGYIRTTVQEPSRSIMGAYRLHICNEHGLAKSKARAPYMPNKQFVKCWDASTTCPVPDCPVSMSFSSREGLRVHLKSKHSYTSDQASSATRFGFDMKPYQGWLKVRRTEVKRTEESVLLMTEAI